MAKNEETVIGPEIKVRLMGRVADIEDSCGKVLPREISVRLSQTENITPRTILKELAEQNPLIADQIIRFDGTPRSSTKILLNGNPPRNLDSKLALARRKNARGVIVIVVIDGDGDGDIDIVIIVMLPCDG